MPPRVPKRQSPRPSSVIVGVRPGPTRDRRGRGARGVLSLPGPLSPAGVPAHRHGRAAFDHLVAGILTSLDHHFEREPDHVEVVVEEAPLLPLNWADDVPGSILNPMPGGFRIVLYRIPLVSRSRTREHLEDNLWTVLLHRLGEAWALPPEDLDPRR